VQVSLTVKMLDFVMALDHVRSFFLQTEL
jgi:hypothetical protein